MAYEMRDFRQIVEIGRAAMGYDDLIELRREVLKGLPSVFSTEMGNFWMFREYPFPRLDLNDVVYEGIEKRDIERFRQYYHKIDPYVKVISADTKIVYTLKSDELPGFTKGEYYNEFLKPQNIHYQLAVYFRAGGKLLGVMGMYRPKSGCAFSVREQNKAELLATYVSAGLERAILMQKIKKSEDMINSICPDLPYQGVIVLDDRLDPIYINGEALKAISGHEADTAKLATTYPALPEDLSLKCQEFSENARRSKDPIKQGIIRCGNGACGCGISANIRSVRSSTGSQLLFILMGDEKARSSEALRKSGLSRREMEVVGLVCEGLRNKEIAEKLFISEYTVENHLRSIYEKMDVPSRTSLINRVASLRTQP